MTAHLKLEIDLDALVENYRLLKNMAADAECSAVVKGNAYGTGIGQAVSALSSAGCRTFFVATLDEASLLDLDDLPSGSVVYVLNGISATAPLPGRSNCVRPIINTLHDLRQWTEQHPDTHFGLHLDTGFNRLGLSAGDDGDAVQLLAGQSFGKCDFVMSHFACADEPQHPMIDRQYAEFNRRAEAFPGVRRSLANSAALVSRPETHFDLVRPGLALYGEQPVIGRSVALKPVVRLTAPVLQIRSLRVGETVGYNARFTADRAMRIALIGAGYADGVPRVLSNSGSVCFGQNSLPFIARVSMDSFAVECSAVDGLEVGDYVTLIGPERSAQEFGAPGGVSSYEVLTRLAPRTRRMYREVR